MVLRIFARQPGQTGDLTQWVNSTNGIVASISAAGNFSTVGTGSFGSSTDSGTGVATAATGWTIQNANGFLKAGWAMVNINCTRTGAALTADSAGQIVDTQIGTLGAAWHQNALITDPLMFFISNAIVTGTVRLNTDNTFDVVTLAPTSSIGTGIAGFRISMTFPV